MKFHIICPAFNAVVFPGISLLLFRYFCSIFQYNWIMTLLFLGELVLIILVFVFYFVPDAKQKLGLFPEKTFKEAIIKYGTVDDQDMKNFIDNLQEDVSFKAA